MDFKKVVEKRYSMRHFHPTRVSEEKIKEIINLAKLAPSAGNLQSYKVVISDKQVANIKAPVHLIICADPEKSASRYGDRGRSLYSLQDATIFAAYLQLAIVNTGLASVWVGAFNEAKIKSLLKIPKNLRPIAIVSFGYPIGEKSGRRRRSYEEILFSP